MSRHAYLVCEEAKEMIRLGNIVNQQGTDMVYFHIGPEGGIRNSHPAVVTCKMTVPLDFHIVVVARIVGRL
jgi:hypothetical protein